MTHRRLPLIPIIAQLYDIRVAFIRPYSSCFAMLLFLFVLCLSPAYCDSTFRFGAVLSTVGVHKDMAEAKQGWQLYFDKQNAANEGRGFYLQGTPGTQGYYFNFSFIHREDNSSKVTHAEQVVDLVQNERIHFLGGSHPTYAADEMRLANLSGVLNYHCCVGPDVFYEHDYETVFGIPASNTEYARMFIRTLGLVEIGTMGVIYENSNTFTNSTCEAAIKFSEELGTIQRLEDFIRTFDTDTVNDDFFAGYVREAKEKKVDVVVACVFPAHGKTLVDAFHDAQYPLKAMFVTSGPTKQDWVDSFDPPWRANDLLSAGQWHEGLKYGDEFFGAAIEYSELYQEKFEGSRPTYLSAGASAVGYTLTKAIEDAFRVCDISKTDGDVEKLLYDPEAIDCDDFSIKRGYDRILEALAELDIETFYGRVKFNDHRRNVGLEPVTTQVFERQNAAGEKYRTIEAVLPLGYATELMTLPANNPYKPTCAPGTYNGPDQFAPCVPCDQGEATNKNNSDHCDSCPLGEWTNKIGQSECQKCPEGTTTHSRGAKQISQCVCRDGYFNVLNKSGISCTRCPEGARCNGGTNAPVPKYGYWANLTARNEVYQCDPAKICPGGGDLKCAKGYTGRLCAECEDGYFSVIQDCYQCPHNVVIVIFVFLLLLGWYLINVIVSRSVSSLEMILGWAQLANIIGDVNLNWTPAMTTMFGVANILDFDVDILEPSCLVNWGFSQNFITQLCLPVVMTLMGCSGYFGTAVVYFMMERNWIKKDGARKEVLAYFVEVAEDKEQLKQKLDSTIATFLASVDITYVTIAKYCFDVFKCETVAGVSVLRVAPEVICDDDKHKKLMAMASLGIVFYVVGYLIYISWKLYDLRSRRAFADPINLRRFGFVYQKYELDYWYTPAIMLIRKLLFVMTLVYLNNPAFQVGTLAIIINASLMIHVYTAPYVDTYLDVLFNFLLLALMFEAFGGLMFYSENLPEQDRKILEWIILITLFVLIAVFLVIFIMEMATKYYVRYLKCEHRKFARERDGPKAFSPFKNKNRALKTAVTLASMGSRHEDKSISFELLDTFRPRFIYQSLRKRPDFIDDWDRLTNMLKDYMSDQSETSYLSMSPVAKFWRKLVDRFPELVDFLAVADESTRAKFNDFATNLYRNFYLTNKVCPLPLMEILNWRDYAPMAQWLAIANQEDRTFFVEFVSDMFRTVGNNEAAEMLESKLRNGGPDPHLETRPSAGNPSKKKKRILDSLSNGAHPFHHSAAKQQLNTVATVALGIRKFRSIGRGHDEGSSAPIERAADETEIELSMTAPTEKVLNNQTSFQSEIDTNAGD